MKIVEAALEAYARDYAGLGLLITEADAESLVKALVRTQNVSPAPSDYEVQKYAADLVRMVARLNNDRTHKKEPH